MADFDSETPWADLARLDVAIATVHAFTQASRAERVVVLLDEGDGRTATMLECSRGEGVTITHAGEAVLVPAEALEGVAPLPLEPPRPAPASAIEIDAQAGAISAPMGAVSHLALAVLDLARAFGGRTVATADFQTRTGDPLSIAARDGDPLVVALGDHQFELPVGRSAADEI